MANSIETSSLRSGEDSAGGGKRAEFVIPKAPEGEFCVFGTVFAYTSTADRLEQLYQQSTYLAQSEPGTIYYCIARDPDPNQRHVFHFFERYAGREAFETHTQGPITTTIIQERLIDRVNAKFLTPIDPVGGPEKNDKEDSGTGG